VFMAKNLKLGRGNLGGVTDETNALAAASDKAAQTALNLTGTFKVLGTQYGLTADVAKSLIVGAKVVNAVLAANGRITPQIADKIRTWAGAMNSATGLTNVMSIAVDNLTSAIDRQAGKVLTLQGDELGWRSALQQANAQLASNSAGLKGNSANALANKRTVLDSTIAVIGFAKQQLISKANLGGASSAVQAQIGWLKKLKDHTGFTAAEIKILVGWLRQIKSEQATIKVKGTGTWSVHTFQAPGQGKHATAAGWLVRGGAPGVDSVPIMAMPGELVVPTNMVRAGAVDHLRGQIPGFAAGGVVGSYRDGTKGLSGWLSTENLATMRALEQSVANAVLAGIKAAQSGGSGGMAGPGGGAPGANAALAMLMYSSRMRPGDWAAWNYVAMRESGWNQFATNPTSGAYGIAQALPPTKYPFAGQAAGGSNPAAQISWMWNYMSGVYGGPQGAAAHERAFNWYGGGLQNGLFTRPTLIGVGERGPELVNITPAGRGGGGAADIHITIVPPVTSNPVDIARHVADVLNKGAMAGVRLRKSLISANG